MNLKPRIMKMQDAEKTWELIRGQARQGTVVRSSGLTVNDKSGSTYASTMNTTIEKEEGEAHFIFSR